jgi:hypothetical protein
VDIYIDAVPGSADPLEYGKLLPWMEIPAGQHRVRVVPVGGSPSDPLLDTEIDFLPDWWATLAMVGGAAGVPLTLQVIVEPHGPIAPGETRLTLLNAMPGSLPINLQLEDGTLLISAVSYPNALLGSNGTYTVDIVAGPRDIQITPFDNRDALIVNLPNAYLAPGRYHFLALAGFQDSPTPFLYVTDPETMDVQDMGANVALPEVGVGVVRVRAAHLALGLGPIDLYLNGELRGDPGLEFAGVGDWYEVPSGLYDLAVTPAGRPLEEAVITVEDAALPAGGWATLAVYGDGERGSGSIQPLLEDRRPIAPGETRVGLFNAVLQAGPVDLRLEDGTLLLGGVVYPDGQDGYATVDIAAGVRTLRVTVNNSPDDILLELPSLALGENRQTLIALAGVESRAIPVLVFSGPE